QISREANMRHAEPTQRRPRIESRNRRQPAMREVGIAADSEFHRGLLSRESRGRSDSLPAIMEDADSKENGLRGARGEAEENGFRLPFSTRVSHRLRTATSDRAATPDRPAAGRGGVAARARWRGCGRRSDY